MCVCVWRVDRHVPQCVCEVMSALYQARTHTHTHTHTRAEVCCCLLEAQGLEALSTPAIYTKGQGLALEEVAGARSFPVGRNHCV